MPFFRFSPVAASSAQGRTFFNVPKGSSVRFAHPYGVDVNQYSIVLDIAFDLNTAGLPLYHSYFLGRPQSDDGMYFLGGMDLYDVRAVAGVRALTQHVSGRAGSAALQPGGRLRV